MNKNLNKIAEKFKKGRIPRREFLNHVNSMILKTPALSGFYDKDIKHDFYVYIISKIDKIIRIYEDNNKTSFKTWFNLVLKREFINFYKTIKKNKRYNFNQAQEFFNSILVQNYDESIKLLKQIDFSFLTIKEKSVISYKYGIKLGNNKIDNSINIIMQKLSRKKIIEYRINKKYLRLLYLQDELNKESDQLNIEKLLIEQERNKKYKRRLEKVFNAFSILPSNKWVGRQLGLAEGTVGVYLHRIKKKFYKKLDINNYLKDPED